MRSKKEILLSVILFFTSLCLLLFAAQQRQNPGYMDEAYYYMGGRNLYEGKGFWEMILWNYLDNPSGLPHPSHLYWMPGASMIAYLGMTLFSSNSYFAASFIFSLIGAIIPVLTYYLGLHFLKEQGLALLAAGFAMAGGYYFVYYSAIDTFSIYSVLGAVFLAVAGFWKSNKRNRLFLKSGILGLLAGAIHLFRADGLLWVGIGLVVLIFEAWQTIKEKRKKDFSHYLLGGLVLLCCYGAVMAPWYLRNMHLFRSPGTPGSSQMLFLTEYNELFAYPGNEISFSNWAQSGISEIVLDRLNATGVNLLGLVGVQHLVFLLPFSVIGIWKRRAEKLTRLFLFCWFVIIFVMSIVFPYAGSRGGYFHSGSSLQIWVYLYSVVGFSEVIHYFKRKRNWNYQQAILVLSLGFFFIYLSASGLIFFQKITGDTAVGNCGWADYDLEFIMIEDRLMELDIKPEETILINDPPSNYVFNRRPSLAIPNGDEETVRNLMVQYGIRYMVLQKNHPQGLNKLFDQQQSNILNLVYAEKEFAIWKLDPNK